MSRAGDGIMLTVISFVVDVGDENTWQLQKPLKWWLGCRLQRVWPRFMGFWEIMGKRPRLSTASGMGGPGFNRVISTDFSKPTVPPGPQAFA